MACHCQDCPKCGEPIIGYWYSISRFSGKKICPKCGNDEAMQDLMGQRGYARDTDGSIKNKSENEVE